ncbi:MmgE/PrpD family protein [Kordiimonas sp. SCSIO 12603]|uniref:MmgE/PrpD family protein n=1 Tax=Kordiimonas sp. SCSIO 12603 TaxID=2829596 RepID=UPI0021055F3F|nr:MmgE/PrpD family protein [Kordiimonas sp. SCSIO 12603]UTW58510.1 MmgE/PrpD family protein [Kordiimonas sp. SCSIO 12603]
MTLDPQNPLHAFALWTSTADRKWSDLALDRARDAITDTVAVMIPGATEPVTKTVQKLAQKWGKGSISTVGFKDGLSAPMAALVNGTAAHALDFDDNFDPAKAHASAVLVPALLAVADEIDANGQDLLDAYIVGLQIIGLVGQGVNPYHRSRGWHATATVGAVGSAAGCARLMGLDPEKTAHTISLATSMAGGFMSQFGTMTKPLHAGLAAAGAVQAAQFAEAGITAGSETLHGEKGMGTLMVGPDVEELRAFMADKDEHGQKVKFRTESIGEPLHIEKYGLKLKRFPNCGSVHRSLDGLLELRSKHGFKETDVENIFVRAPAAHLRNLMYERPTNSMEAKFSLEYGLAVGLLTGNAGLADYLDEVVERPEVTALLPLVKKEYVEKLESDFPTEVHVTLKSGEKVSTKVDMPVGSSANPLSNAQLWEKFQACVNGLLSEQQFGAIRHELEATRDSMKVRSLTGLLTG